MDIVAFVLGLLAAALGVGTLGRVGAAGRDDLRHRSVEASPKSPARVGSSSPVSPRQSAAPLRTRSQVRRDERPADLRSLLEFSHPAIAVTGLACLFGLAYIKNQAFAVWGFWVLVTAAVAGLGLLTMNSRAARRRTAGRGRGVRGDERAGGGDGQAGGGDGQAGGGDGQAGGVRPAAPVRLIMLHGLAASATVVLAALLAFRVV